MASESLASNSTRFVPARQLPAVNNASHHTIGKGSSQTHQGVFRVLIESKNILPFARNKKSPRSPGKNSKSFGGSRNCLPDRRPFVFAVHKLKKRPVDSAAAPARRQVGVAQIVNPANGAFILRFVQKKLPACYRHRLADCPNLVKHQTP